MASLSLLGIVIIGRNEGDTVTVRTPGGAREYEIQKIEFVEEEISESE